MSDLLSGVRHFKILGPPPPEGAEVWWRADDNRYADFDPWAMDCQPDTSSVAVELTPYVVKRTTPKTVILSGSMGDEHRVLGRAIRQFAVPTIEIALQDLVARKRRHVSGCAARLKQAEEHLKAAELALQQSNVGPYHEQT